MNYISIEDLTGIAARALSRTHRLTALNTITSCTSSFGLVCTQTRLDLGSHGLEGLFNVMRVLGRCLEKLNAVLVSHSFSLLISNNLLALHVGLVTNQQFINRLIRIPINLTQPMLNVLKRLTIRNIVHYNNAMSTSIVRTRNSPEPLLTSSVPNLKLNCFAINLVCTNFLHWTYTKDEYKNIRNQHR